MERTYRCLWLFPIFVTVVVLLQGVECREDIADEEKSVLIAAIKEGIDEHNALLNREGIIDNNVNAEEPNFGINDYGEYEYMPDNIERTGNDLREQKNLEDNNDDSETVYDRDISIADELGADSLNVEEDPEYDGGDRNDLENGDNNNVEDKERKINFGDEYDLETAEKLLDTILLRDGIIV